jgi:hypothetical protein
VRCGTHKYTTYINQNPSWKASSFSAGQEILLILWNLKVHCRAHNSQLPVPILSQINPVHALSSYFSKTHFNICLQFDVPTCLFPTGFSNNTAYLFLFSLYVLHALSISSFLLNYRNGIWWGIQIIKLSISCYFHVGQNIFFTTRFSKTLSLWFFLDLKDQVSLPHKLIEKMFNTKSNGIYIYHCALTF